MCRLALMNANILQVLSQQELADVFSTLEQAQGGHGNGCAALWQETAHVKIRKGLSLSANKAAQHLSSFAQAGADWMLYHTRWASSGRKTSQNCHPFQSGNVTLAHNGHDWTWARLGRQLGITDSECITRIWGRLALPLDTLMEASGVFLGFQGAFPFVVKTQSYTDLVLAVHHKTGALLFISQLPPAYVDRFDEVIDLGRFTWLGVSPLDLKSLPRLQRYEHWFHQNYDAPSFSPQPRIVAKDARETASQHPRTDAAEITLDDLRAYLAKIDARQEKAPTANSPILAQIDPLE